jgi:hypothetical protein
MGSVSEASLAALLAEVLADRYFWGELASAPSATEPSPILAERAVVVYRSVGRFARENIYLDEEEPVLRAIAVLRDLAACAAAASYARSLLIDLELPGRPAFEWLIRVDDVDDWAAGLGYPLPIPVEEGTFPDELWPKGQGPDDPTLEDFLADVWEPASDVYGKMLDWLDRSELQPGLISAAAEGSALIRQFREGAATFLLGIRGWIAWARRNLPVEGHVALGMVALMVEGIFVAGFEWPEDGVMSPDPAFLSTVLRDSGALDWLIEHGGDVPEWIV